MIMELIIQLLTHSNLKLYQKVDHMNQNNSEQFIIKMSINK